MLRRAWKPITATAILVGAPAYGFYRFKYKQQTFDIAIRTRSPDGKPEMAIRRFPLLSMQAVDARLGESATYESKHRPGGIVWKHTTATLPSNDPIEDANANAIVQRDDTDPSAPGDLLFFAVMDGHSGTHTSQLLSKVLINAVVLELSALIAPSSSSKNNSLLTSIKSAFWRKPITSLPADNDPQRVSLAIQNAFTNLDSELINAPLRVLAANLDDQSRKNKSIPDLSQHPLALTTMLPAISGSCALMAVLDTVHRNLYVACTGDCRAVAGIWEESEDGQGSWRVEVLSEDQTGRNPNELERIRSEHPADEADYVIQNGRVLGGLEPSRAFGDARYKWPRAVQETLNQAFLVGNNKPMRPAPNSYKTPPYVTSLPVVTHRKLDIPLLSDSAPGSKSALRFLVLATDGLWDQLSSKEVVSLVAAHLSGLNGIVPKSTLPTLVPTSTGSPTVEGKDKRHNQDEDGSWAFVDDNVSTHLIRNAFGGGDKYQLRKLLSIPAPHSRRFRDDVTVTVVWWEDGREDAAKVTTLPPKQSAKAKL